MWAIPEGRKKNFISHKLTILVLGDMIMKGEGHTDWV